MHRTGRRRRRLCFTNNALSPTDTLATTTGLDGQGRGQPGGRTGLRHLLAGDVRVEDDSRGGRLVRDGRPRRVGEPRDARAEQHPAGRDAGPSPHTAVEGIPVQFDGTGSSSICGFPALQLDFSDGGTATGPKPSHTFAEEGTYSGTLTATDTSGLTSSTTFTIDVADAPLTSACAMPAFTLQAFTGPTATFHDAATTGS